MIYCKNLICSIGFSKTDTARSSAVSESQKVIYDTRGILRNSSLVCLVWFLVVSSPILNPFASKSIMEITLMEDKKCSVGVSLWKPKLKKKKGVKVKMTKKSCPGERGILLLSFFLGLNHLFAPDVNTEMNVASSPGIN